jgi:hypothetical protein
MTTDEKMLFSNLLFSHKHLWCVFQEYRYLQEHPEMDWETVHERFSEEAYEVYQSLADALLEDRPLQEALQTVLLHSQLTEVEVRDSLKNR